MGLVEEQQKMVNLEYRKAKQEAEKATKEAQKLQKQLEKIKEEKEAKKIYEKDLTKAVEYDLKKSFENVFEMYGLEKANIYLNLKNNRNNIINTVAKSEAEHNFAQKNYYKILKSTEEIFKRDNEAKRKIETSRLAEVLAEVQEQQVKTQKNQEIKNSILNTLCFICMIPFYIIKYFIIFIFMLGHIL